MTMVKQKPSCQSILVGLSAFGAKKSYLKMSIVCSKTLIFGLEWKGKSVMDSAGHISCPFLVPRPARSKELRHFNQTRTIPLPSFTLSFSSRHQLRKLLVLRKRSNTNIEKLNMTIDTRVSLSEMTTIHIK